MFSIRCRHPLKILLPYTKSYTVEGVIAGKKAGVSTGPGQRGAWSCHGSVEFAYLPEMGFLLHNDCMNNRFA
ncbi:MAG: hypothetical protein NVS3B11_07100 [Collimonas sp.]